MAKQSSSPQHGHSLIKHEPTKPPGTIWAWNPPLELQWGKMPELTLWFWIIKIAATTLGETAPEI